MSGSGTLVTGGTRIDPKEIPATSEAYKVLNGPSAAGTVKIAYSRVVKPGDIIDYSTGRVSRLDQDNRPR